LQPCIKEYRRRVFRPRPPGNPPASAAEQLLANLRATPSARRPTGAGRQVAVLLPPANAIGPLSCEPELPTREAAKG